MKMKSMCSTMSAQDAVAPVVMTEQAGNVSRFMHQLLACREVSDEMRDLLMSYVEAHLPPSALSREDETESCRQRLREAFNDEVDVLLASFEDGTLTDEEVRSFWQAHRLPFIAGGIDEYSTQTGAGCEDAYPAWMHSVEWMRDLIESLIPTNFVVAFKESELSAYALVPEVTGRPSDYPCGMWSYTALFRSRLPLGLLDRLMQCFMEDERANSRASFRMSWCLLKKSKRGNERKRVWSTDAVWNSRSKWALNAPLRLVRKRRPLKPCRLHSPRKMATPSSRRPSWTLPERFSRAMRTRRTT